MMALVVLRMAIRIYQSELQSLLKCKRVLRKCDSHAAKLSVLDFECNTKQHE